MCRHHHHNFVNVVAKSFRNFAFSVLSIDSNCPKHERDFSQMQSTKLWAMNSLKDSSKSKISITALNFTTWQLTKTPGIILIINLHHHNQQWSIISFFGRQNDFWKDLSRERSFTRAEKKKKLWILENILGQWPKVCFAHQLNHNVNLHEKERDNWNVKIPSWMTTSLVKGLGFLKNCQTWRANGSKVKVVAVKLNC